MGQVQAAARVCQAKKPRAVRSISAFASEGRSSLGLLLSHGEIGFGVEVDEWRNLWETRSTEEVRNRHGVFGWLKVGYVGPKALTKGTLHCCRLVRESAGSFALWADVLCGLASPRERGEEVWLRCRAVESEVSRARYMCMRACMAAGTLCVMLRCMVSSESGSCTCRYMQPL